MITITPQMEFPCSKDNLNGITVRASTNIKPFGPNKNMVVETPLCVMGGNFIGVNKIGAFTYTNTNASISRATIGRYCAIGPDVTIGYIEHPTKTLSSHYMFISLESNWTDGFHTLYDDFSNMTNIRKEMSKLKTKRNGITIGNDVWICGKSIILEGVTIGDGAIVATGSVVTKDVLPYTIVGGVPAKLIRHRFDFQTIAKLLDLRWWDYGPDILKGLDITKPDEILGTIGERIQNGFPKYECDKFEFDTLEKTINRITSSGEKAIINSLIKP